MKASKNIAVVDFEANGHHFDLYIRGITAALSGYKITIFLPIHLRSSVASKEAVNAEIVYFTSDNELFEMLTQLSPNATIFPSGDLIPHLLQKRLKMLKTKLLVIYIKSLRLRFISLKHLVKAILRFLEIRSILKAENAKVAFIEFDAISFWRFFFPAHKLVFIPDFSLASWEKKIDCNYVRASEISDITVIGAINKRKNIDVLFRSLRTYQCPITIRLIGAMSDEIVEFLAQYPMPSSVKLEVDNRFLTNSEYLANLKAGNLIWLCYSGKDVGSSAVLIDAITLSKNVVVSDQGYMGKLISRYSRVKKFNSRNINFSELKRAYLDGRLRFTESERDKFISDYGYENFSRNLLSIIDD